ncbi:MAG: hypothetical protein ACLGI9_09900, partial [Thermoanaerobaculia bacterium]
MKRLLLFGFAAMTLVSFGCAITDYEGHSGHQTASEARLWGYEIAFSGTGSPELDGTYSYTVKYDNRTARDVNLRIVTYRNPIVGSFSRDGQIDREGDDIQGRRGILGGKFAAYWTTTDPAAGCQFDLNRIQSHGGAPPPAILLCDVATEEIDKDLELQAPFTSVGDLFGRIWSGALDNGFTLELTGIKLGGVNVPLSSPLSINARANGTRPIQFSIDLSQAGAASLIQGILANTSNR